MARYRKGANGKYLIKERAYEQLTGSRRQVWNGTAYKTKYGLTKNGLVKNKSGRYVSRKKHISAKKEKRLEKHGYFAEKGRFGMVRRSSKQSTRKRARSVGGTRKRR